MDVGSRGEAEAHSSKCLAALVAVLGVGAGGGAGAGQGLTLVHIFAQLELFLSLKPAKDPATWDKMCSR